MLDRILLTLVFAALAMLCCAQELRVGEAQSSANPCLHLKTCSKCLQTANVCAWCTDENFPRSSSRCDVHKRLLETCPKNLVWLQSYLNVIKSDNMRGGDKNEEPIQVQPQVLDIMARPNDPITFSLTFRQAENYPVDLYFLLDLSFTMVEQKEAQRNLIALGRDILPSLENITKNVYLGFGTFVDKFVMPYSPWTDDLLKNRCPLPDQLCRKPHDFINQLPLSEDVDKFAPKMEEAIKAVSQSFDDSEGGMDGLMQALACEKDIAWRERSRRIIVYASNSRFHLAGDGLLGGATKSNDGSCHLNAQQSYNPAENVYDYPSVSQIAGKLRDKSTNVIFVVMPNVVSHYMRLENFLLGSSVGTLESQSGNIIKLIRENYDKLRSKIEFAPRRADNVEFTFRSKCLDNVLRETASCDGLEIKDKVTFDVKMTVSTKACENRTGIVQRSVDIAAVGLAEKLTINLKIVCDCACEGPAMEERNSPKCTHGNGTLECGVCTCNPGRYGRLCECDEGEISTSASLIACRADKNEDLLCSGHGECICGKCKCLTLSHDRGGRYSGQYCECDDYSCPRSSGDGSLCGGPGRGRCVCGNCECLNQWSGPACDCSTDNTTCSALSSGLECNDQGVCECGRCRCYPDSQYMGPTCEECPSCPSRCTQYRDCAQCVGFKTGKYGPEECKEKCPTITVTDELGEEGGRIRKCNFRDTDDCLFYFTYEDDEDNNLIIKVQRTKDCPKEVNVVMIVGLVVAGVVLIPLLALCMFIFIRNRRDAAEFAEFMREKERAKRESGANPSLQAMWGVMGTDEGWPSNWRAEGCPLTYPPMCQAGRMEEINERLKEQSMRLNQLLPMACAQSEPSASSLPDLIKLTASSLPDLIKLTAPSLPDLIKLTAPSLPDLIKLTAPSLPDLIKLTAPSLPDLIKLTAPSLPDLIKLTAPSLPDLIKLTASSLPDLIKLTAPSLPDLIKLTAPSLPDLIKLTAPSLPDLIKLTAPSLPDLIKLTASSLPDLIKLTAPSLPDLIKLTAPSLPDLIKLTAPSLPYLIKLTAPSLPDLIKLTAPSLPDLIKLTAHFEEEQEIIEMARQHGASSPMPQRKK